MSRIAIISARGGSKGVPDKNIRLVGDKPLITWSIEAALASRLLHRVVVSTDSPKIAEIARQSGGEVPFMRPAELARDSTPGIDPVLHAVRWLEDREGYVPDWVVLLQPTSPLRVTDDIDRAFEMASEKNADAIVSVTEGDHHPYWMKRLDPDGRMHDFITLERPITRRQDLPPVYAVNGAVYLVRREVLVRTESFFPENTFGMVMPRDRSLDVDTPWDLYLADLILKDIHERNRGAGS
ncbi:MAG: acylneuraminate cytidylyltransferase family protein [Desulfomonile tiedjei]|nr:acylneuraminate cytidylyltransferase family protein [Desulfomonile tiedjei]